MPFQPQPHQHLNINNIFYQVMEHPAAPRMPYGQEGRQATVYQLGPVAGSQKGLVGLKVFKPRYQLPDSPGLTGRLTAFSTIGGLQVCERTILTPKSHSTLVQTYPELAQAVIMPWISGPNWMEIILDKRELTHDQSQASSLGLARALATMEAQQMAHCDLSGSNLLLPILEPGATNLKSPVELVDVEQLYAPSLVQPKALPAGSPGYAHREAGQGLWSPTADRFAGAILLAEILGWCDKTIRNESWEESYFDPDELQQLTGRYRALIRTLHVRWGSGVALLFEQAWHSKSLQECASFHEWVVALVGNHPVSSPVVTGNAFLSSRSPSALSPAFDKSQEAAVRVLMETGEKLYAEGDLSGALAVFRRAYGLASADSPLLGPIYQRLKELRTSQELSRLTYNMTPLINVPSSQSVLLSKNQWQPVIKRNSRVKVLFSLAGLSLVISVGLFFLLSVLGQPLMKLANSLTRQWQYQGLSAVLLAGLIGGLQLWIFRERIKPSHRVWFVVFTSLGGLVGGILGGLIYDYFDTTTSLVGALVGAISGGLSSILQNFLIGSKGQGVKWIMANFLGWAIIWLGGFMLAWAFPQPASMAAGGSFILALSGLCLTFLLLISPDIEF